MNADVNVNGAAGPSMPARAATTAYVARSSSAIAPGQTGPVPYRMRRAGRIVDVTVVDGELVRAALGQRRIDLQGDGAGVISDALSREPYDGGAGSYLVLTVRNVSSEPKVLDVSIHVTSEQGPEIDVRSPFRMPDDDGGAVRATASGAPRRTPTSPMPTSPRPRAVHAPTDAAPPARTPTRGGGGGVRRPPPGSDERSRARARARAKAAQTDAATAKPPAVLTVVPIVRADDGERVVVLYRAHAEALSNLLDYRAPIRPVLRPPLVQALRRAVDQLESEAGVESGQIGVTLPTAELERLHLAVQRHQEYQLADRELIAARLRSALRHEEPVDAAAPPAPAPAVAAVAAVQPPTPAPAPAPVVTVMTVAAAAPSNAAQGAGPSNAAQGAGPSNELATNELAAAPAVLVRGEDSTPISIGESRHDAPSDGRPE